MKHRSLVSILAGLLVAALAGCGGGGGGSPATTVVSGMASKGLVRNAKVQVFSVTAPHTFALLAEGTTDDKGNYSIDLGSYAGPVKVEVSGGQFKDETTGTFTPMLFALRAVAGSTVTGNNGVMVTGLTEIATKKIEDSTNNFDAASIAEANRAVGAFFGVTDILGAVPADVTVAGAGGDKSYGLALASLMQYGKRPGGVIKAFEDFSKLLNGQLDPTSQSNNQALADQVIASFLADKNAFLGNATQNLSGITGTTEATTAEVKLVTEGTLPSGTQINGLELTLTMPHGVTIPAAQDGSVDPTALTAPVKISGVATLAKATPLAGGMKFTAGADTAPNKLKLVIVFSGAEGFDVGEFATVTCTIAPNTIVTPSHFMVSGFKAAAVGTSTNSIGQKLEGLTAAATVTLR